MTDTMSSTDEKVEVFPALTFDAETIEAMKDSTDQLLGLARQLLPTLERAREARDAIDAQLVGHSARNLDNIWALIPGFDRATEAVVLLSAMLDEWEKADADWSRFETEVTR